MTKAGFIRALVAVLMMTTLAGCGFKDIDKRFFVVAMGFDLPEGEDAKGYKITLKLAVASAKTEPGSSRSEVETVQASTIAEAVRVLKSHVDKELDFGHCKLYVLGEKLVQSGYIDVLSWLSRRRDVQSVSFLAMAKPDASSILNVSPPNERFTGNTFFLIFGKDGTESSYLVTEYLFDFMRKVFEKGVDPLLPIMKKEKNGFVTKRIALLDKEKLVLKLSSAETETFNQISNNFNKSGITAELDGKTIVLSTSSVRTHYRIVRRGDEHAVLMKVNIHGILEEAPFGIYNESWPMLEKKFEDNLAKEITALLIKMQKARVDPIGFGLRYRATHKGTERTWLAWQLIYPELKFEVQAKVNIDGTGITR